MLWLWGINVRYFERTGVRYDVCFSSKDQKYLLDSREIFQVRCFACEAVLHAGFYSSHILIASSGLQILTQLTIKLLLLPMKICQC